MTWALMITALGCTAGGLVLGWWVTDRARPPAPRVAAGTHGGCFVPLAVAFTDSGYADRLTILGIGTVAGALALRQPAIVPVAIFVSQAASQGVVMLIKAAFARARPERWIHRRERGYSYPSGHATTGIVFYGSWLAVIWRTPLPETARIAAVMLLALWIGGIGWSRVALGAHYLSDVIGGYLFGIAWLCAAAALLTAGAAGITARIE